MINPICESCNIEPSLYIDEDEDGNLHGLCEHCYDYLFGEDEDDEDPYGFSGSDYIEMGQD